jgi:SAM-dependent methyltransferase
MTKREPKVLAEGTAETQEFYDDAGWREVDGQTLDAKLFGVREDGPIRIAAAKLRMDRLRRFLAVDGKTILEAGCGGAPELRIATGCATYTGVDFSATGIEHARKLLQSSGLDGQLHVADITALPFADGSFDIVYSAHVLYHIADAESQAQALRELMRVLRPGGRAALLVANPRPLAFPVRLARRLIADTQLLSAAANLVRSKPPLPYKPMPIGWMRRQLAPYGAVSVLTDGMASTQFNHGVTEHGGFGRLAWMTMAWLEREYPRAAAHLGNFVQIMVVRNG